MRITIKLSIPIETTNDLDILDQSTTLSPKPEARFLIVRARAVFCSLG